MIGSYFLTAWRSLLRNKLFSAINITGLAISMSVGLLMIAFLSDLLSYDGFHKNKDRIYRVTTIEHQPNEMTVELASTSVKAGMKIRETIPGVEEVTLIRRGFGGIAETGAHTLPLSALWADTSFFTVFTFPLLEGNPATALKEPYSLVLTEKTAKKLFGETNAMGKLVRFDTLNYVVTGIMENIPKFSHLQFEALVSFSTVALQKPDTDGDFLSWENIYMNYVYLTLAEETDQEIIQSKLTRLSAAENAQIKNKQIMLSLQPITEIALGKNLVNPIGPTLPVSMVWVSGGLAIIVMLSACFNYTNLSIARSLKRSREVGIRKIIGALKSQVLGQFIVESVLICWLALFFSFFLFLILRGQFLSLHPWLQNLALLDISLKVIFYFIVLATGIGIAAGFLPALFFSRIPAIQVLRNASSLQLFRRVTLRKILIVIQYSLSLVFISATLIGYKQYRHFISFDLGFKTENILNISLQGNKVHLLQKELAGIPEVDVISTSLMINSLGSFSGVHMKYASPKDSALVYYNSIDENYIPLHSHRLVAGKNFTAKPVKEETEVIVNEQFLKHFHISPENPAKAIGETVFMGDNRMIIRGVVKDFHHGTAFSKIEPFIFRYSPDIVNYINVKVTSTDWAATLDHINKAWRKIDSIHPLEAAFYDDQIEQSYKQFFALIKISVFLTFLALSVASLGLFGMVVFTTTTRIKEIGIRKVMGASEANLVYVLSKEFLVLLLIALLVALPSACLFFDKIILANIAFPAPIFTFELVLGVASVMLISFLMIGSQTLKAAQSNPAEVLKNE